MIIGAKYVKYGIAVGHKRTNCLKYCL